MISNDLQWLFKSQQELRNYYNQYNFYKETNCSGSTKGSLAQC